MVHVFEYNDVLEIVERQKHKNKKSITYDTLFYYIVFLRTFQHDVEFFFCQNGITQTEFFCGDFV